MAVKEAPVADVDHLSEWMKLQEEVNKEFVQALIRVQQHLQNLEERLRDLETRR